MNRALRIVILIASAIITSVTILSLLGILSNYYGNSFGFGHKNGYACAILSILLIYAVVSNGWLTWIGELVFIALDLYILWVGGKTEFVCLLMLVVVLMWRHYRKNNGIPFQDRKAYGCLRYFFVILYLPVVLLDRIAERIRLFRIKSAVTGILQFSFPILFGLSILLALSYRQYMDILNVIPISSTFGDRLMFSLMGFEAYPVTLFGTPIETVVPSGEIDTSLYFVIDSGYTRLLLEYGIVPMIVFLVAVTSSMVILHKKRFDLAVSCLSLLAVIFFMEFGVLPYIILMLVFLPAYCIYSKQPDIAYCERLNLSSLVPVQRWVFGVTAAVLIVSFALWSVTAYRITSWRGWMPEYNATLVVPRSLLEAEDDLLAEAALYLREHSDSYCIVECETDRDFLVSGGIDEGRIYIYRSTSIDDMLVDAHRIIEDNDLPERLTILAYSMQMERIYRHAEVLHIPVNSIPIKPTHKYLRLFGTEQWRLICGN